MHKRKATSPKPQARSAGTAEATPIPDDVLREVARRFRALSAFSRLKVLDALMGGPLSMADLQTEAGLEQSNLSRQVAELERAGCVVRSKSGRSVTVEIADPTLKALCELVCGALKEQADAAHSRYRAV